ncbi:hypothetical protein D0T11_11650 [Hymenobacter rubripertinctus]|uniref:Uncharacterized protein n=1 Tax=Hymenobacter rubripertinctus TaxID=2029981 RepID=A0A418QXC0_9BACT|nr:hypothetical protein D0T11_11650 [Hymenobacter rubripertinctus]
MAVDFFSGVCQNGDSAQDVTTAATFGLCDDRPRARAYLDHATPAQWVAVVDNRSEHEVTFTSIDNCLEIRRSDGNMESRCDGMLTYAGSIIFVELKEKNRSFLEEGLGQLETTILLFAAAHPERTYLTRKAYLANSRHPRFAAGRNTRAQQFRDRTGITPLVENTIVL